MPKKPEARARGGNGTDSTIAITQKLLAWIRKAGRHGETVEDTLRRVFSERGHRPDDGSGPPGRMVLGDCPTTTIRIAKSLKSWIIGRTSGYETLDHAIRRLAGWTKESAVEKGGRK